MSGRSRSSLRLTSSDALAISCWNMCRGISFRSPICSARMESVFDRNGVSLRDRQKVWLALGSDVVDQRLGIEPLGVLQHRSSDIDRIIERKVHDHPEGRVAGMSQSPGELGAGRLLDFIRKASDHLAEDPDLIFGVTALYQQIGGVPKRAGPALGRTPQNGLVQLLQ